MLAPRDALAVAADGVGLVSVVLGGALVVDPDRSGRRLGLDRTSRRTRRLLGATDLGLGLGILAGRTSDRRWCAVAARSVLHLAFARAYASGGRRGAAAAMCALLAIDAGIAAGLRRLAR